MKKPLSPVILMVLLLCTAANAVEGIFTVFSPTIITDERPILWINLQIDNNSNLHYFKGPLYDFMGITVQDDTSGIIAGQNTAGLAIAYTLSQDLVPDTSIQITAVLKKALGICATAQDLGQLLSDSPGTNAIFGCIDNLGNAVVIETDSGQVITYNAKDQKIAPKGFLVRQQFSMHANKTVQTNSWRYHRVNYLLAQRLKSSGIGPEYILQTVARDIASEDLAPYPLPYNGQYKKAPKHFVKTENTINNHLTNTCLVFYGSSALKPTEYPGFLYIPGDPLCGIATPLWPKSGSVPAALSGSGFTKIRNAISAIHDNIYRKSKWPEYFDSKMLAKGKDSRLQKNLSVEKEILEGILPQNLKMESLQKIQNNWANRVLRALH